MKPVNVNAFDVLGDRIAASNIAFGAAVAWAAAGTVQATRDVVAAGFPALLGIADIDLVEKDEDGFYSQYDVVPIITAGRCRVWVTSNEDDKEDIVAGDYLEIADLGGTNAKPVGVFQQMGADGGACTGQIREALSVARALEDVTLTNIEPCGVAVTAGATTVTIDSADMILLALAAGDYILLEDHDGNCMMNRVKSVTDTVITLQIASTVAMDDTTHDDVHKLHQVEVMLI